MLSSNYRSVAPILEFVNNVFEKIMRVDPLIQPPYAPLIAGRLTAPTMEFSGPDVDLIRFVPEDEQDWSAEEGRLVEAQAIADGGYTAKMFQHVANIKTSRFYSGALMRSSRISKRFVHARFLIWLREKNLFTARRSW